MAEELVEVAPLTRLTEDETIFRDSVHGFARTQVAPLAREMDEHAKFPRSLVDALFSLGVMGIEIPEAHGGAGGRSSTRCWRSKQSRHRDPSVGVLVDVQNTLVNNALIRWGSDDQKQRYLPRLARTPSAPTPCRRPARAATPSPWPRGPWKRTASSS